MLLLFFLALLSFCQFYELLQLSDYLKNLWCFCNTSAYVMNFFQLYSVLVFFIILKLQEIIQYPLIIQSKKMYNLHDIQQNLKALIKQLKSIQSVVAEPQIKKKSNSSSVLLKIPKGLLLIQVCSFLTMQQINYLSNSCFIMRKTIYSPLGWKFIGRQKTPYPIQVVSFQSNFKSKMKRISAQEMMQMNLYDSDEQKFIAQERNKFKSILLNKFSSYLNSKQKYQAHRDKVRSQMGILFKMKQQILYLQQIRKQLDQKNKLNKEKLKQLSEGFQVKIRQMDELNDNLLKERTKLQNQKQALANKVREYQHQIQVIKQDSQKSKQILKRLKNYLLYKQL